MRSIWVILFVSFYFIAMIKPVAPLVDYWINKDFIAEVLCINKDKPQMQCDGKCHLVKELKATTEPVTPDGPAPFTLSLKDYPIGFVTLFKVASVYPSYNSINSDYEATILQGYSTSVFQPPQC